MCKRIFGTTILKNLHVGMKGMNIHAVAGSCCVKIRCYCRPYTKNNIGCLLAMYSLDKQDLQNSFNGFINLLFPLFLA